MRAAAATLLMLGLVTVSPELRYFRFERPLQNLPAQSGQACVALDATLFAQSANNLSDLRLYRDGTEIPYAIQLASPVGDKRSAVELVNKGTRASQTVFDAELPEGRYSDLELSVARKDFIGTAEVFGSQQNGGVATKLGSFTIFDLSKQKLGRSTVLHLPESNFRYLHFQIAGPFKPEEITELSVVRVPVSQPRFVTIGETAQFQQKGHSAVFELPVSGNVPVDRVEFTVGAPAQFSREVNVRVESASPASIDGRRDGATSIVSGDILRVHSEQNGHRIDEENLAIAAPYANFEHPSKWVVTVDNGDDAPLKISSVRLQMIERDVCFDAEANGQYMLAYGDPALNAPRYDYATLFRSQANAARLSLSAQVANAHYEVRPDDRPFTEKHPALLWSVLVLVIVLLAAIAWRSVKRVGADTA